MVNMKEIQKISFQICNKKEVEIHKSIFFFQSFNRKLNLYTRRLPSLIPWTILA